MLINALCDYADKREKGRKEKELKKGWSEQGIHFKINLSPDGKIVSIDDVREAQPVRTKGGKESTKLVPINVALPERTQKTCIDANFIEHRPLYIFGLDFNKGVFTPDTDNDKARKSHKAFVEHELEFFADLDSEICKAYKNFIETWNPDKETENPELLKISKEYKTAKFRFALTGSKGFLDEDDQFVAKYTQTVTDKKNAPLPDDTVFVNCGILGQTLPAARIHDKIEFPGGRTTGCILVGMKYPAFESYGKKQSYNCSISEEAMKKYTSTLNQLLKNRRHRVIIDDMVILFFAIKTNDTNECDLMWNFLSDAPSAADTEQFIQGMFEKTKSGMTGDTNLELDENVTFYIAGLTPNDARICQKFLCRDTFGNIIENLIQHQKDFQIDAETIKQISFSQIKKELISPKSTKDKVPPPLMTNILLAALNGTNYPNALLETVVRRVKTDSDEEKNHYIKLNSVRVGIIKACINRKLRKSGKEEEITMSLNTENTNPAYLCGRIFAVYEKIQKDASGDLNRTIKDSYFASACARPAAIMPKLSHLAQNHLRKLSEGCNIYYSNLIGEIMNGLDGAFPQTLDLDSQGEFIIGYYQQNKALYTARKQNN